MFTVYVDDLAVLSCCDLERARQEARTHRAFHPRASVFILL